MIERLKCRKQTLGRTLARSHRISTALGVSLLWSVAHPHKEALNGGSPTLEENTKIGENLRLCPNIEETLKLSLKLGGSFRGEFVQKEL